MAHAAHSREQKSRTVEGFGCVDAIVSGCKLEGAEMRGMRVTHLGEEFVVFRGTQKTDDAKLNDKVIDDFLGLLLRE